MAKKERKYIKIRGASEHNLKCVSLDIPRDEFVVFTGLSPHRVCGKFPSGG